VLARNCPSALSANAQISPALMPSVTVPCSLQSAVAASQAQSLMVPSKPAEAAIRPVREVQMWWQPRGWAGRLWRSGMSEVLVEWIFRDEEPEAERMAVGVTAREKMSDGCAIDC
jgi:hypothetical protein